MVIEEFTSCQSISIHEEMNPLARDTMEDSFRVVDGFLNDPKGGFFAVFDGHGGRAVSSFVQTALDRNLADEFSIKYDGTTQEKIRRAFLRTDIECMQNVQGSSGSTAVVCLLRNEEQEKRLYTANIGDSRAVLSMAGKIIRLSHDHKANDPDEINRIGKTGGFVLKERVLGILAISRSFGDFALKEYVIADPFITCNTLDPDDSGAFIIIACDGLWDVVSDKESVEIVQSVDVKRKDEAAKVLVDEAIKRGSTDNITIVVVFL